MRTLEQLGISPAPWSANGLIVTRTAFDQFSANIFPATVAYCYDDAEARLIAAAPELYEALRECEAFISSTNPHSRLIGTIRNALAKAGGEE